jgi:hypothetical protein
VKHPFVAHRNVSEALFSRALLASHPVCVSVLSMLIVAPHSLSKTTDQGDRTSTLVTVTLTLTPLIMPARPVTRKTCSQLPRYKGSATISQRVAALRRKIVYKDSFAVAVEHVNTQSGTLAKENILSESTLRRLFHSLPPHLQQPINADEGVLLAFIQQQQAEQRKELDTAHSYMTQVEEELLVQWVTEMAKINLPMNRSRVIEEARSIIFQQRGVRLESTMRTWYKKFKRRHPALKERICQNISKQRISAQANAKNITNYFALLAQFINYPPSQIYAGDETGLDGDGDREHRALFQVGTQRPTQELDSYREHTSLMHIGNAAGESLPIIFIFKGKAIDQAVVPQIPDDALVGCQENGYFIGDHFLRVLQHLDQHGAKDRPLLFIIDGAKGHIDVSALDWAVERGIHVLCLPSNTTHILQVADVALFGPFKTLWKSACEKLKEERGRSQQQQQRCVRRGDIVSLVLQAWGKAMTPENVKSGFRRTGIYPYDPAAHTHTKQKQLKSLGGLPLLLSPIKELLDYSVIAEAVQRTPSVIESSPVKKEKCGECGSSLKKKVERRVISTAAGILLTGATAREEIRKKNEEQQAEKEAKEKRRMTREEKKKEKEAAATPKNKGRKRKAAEKAREDKENEDPNAVVAVNAEPERLVMRLRMHPGFAVIAMPTFD